MTEMLVGVCVMAGSALAAMQEQERRMDALIDDFRQMREDNKKTFETLKNIEDMLEDIDELSDDDIDELLALTNKYLSK